MSRRMLWVYAVVAGGGLALGFFTHRAAGRAPTTAASDQAALADSQVVGSGTGLAPEDGRQASAVDVRDRLSPRHQRYDALYKAAYLKLTTAEVFEQEPREPAFADRREQFMEQAFQPLLGELVPTATVSDVECRTACCVVHVRAPQSAWSKSVQGYLAWGELSSIAAHAFADGGTGYEITACSGRATLDHQAFETMVTARLAQVAPDLRALRDAALAGGPDGKGVPDR